ncbi:MAG TPA: peptidylprolyl isomerase [Usitatibacteraceae bacterium]|nr:peptidylprolyl isomerase [Usitatibacteraceae bacterium]
MQLKLKPLAILLAAALAAPVSYAQADKPAKAAKSAKADGKISVNGVTIPQAYFDAMNKEREMSGQPSSPEINNAIRDELISREVLSQAARKKGLDKESTVAAQMEMARQAVLIRAYFDDYVKNNPVTEAQLKSNYAQYVAQLGDKEYKARHILVDSEDDAKKVIVALKAGESFEKLAKEKSKDTGSKEQGGDLDWGPAGRYVPEFGNAMKALQKGQTTDAPVKSPFGYHVIRLDDSRAMKIPTFDEVKDNFRQRAQQEQVAKLVQDLRSKAKIEEK